MYDIAIVGGGASGLVSAISAKRTCANADIAVIEALPKVGKKILATGNGRCNLTNLNAEYSDYSNSSFVKPILEKYPPETIVDFFETIGLKCISDTHGRVYPMSNTAMSVLDCLLFEIKNLGIKIITDTHVDDIKTDKDIFILNNEIKAKKIIITSGGKSSPSQGSDGSGYELLKKLGHSITPCFAGLVQLTVNEKFVKSLKGIRAKAAVELSENGKIIDKSKGEVLFTEYGLSGIAIMDISRKVKNGNYRCCIDLLPKLNKKEITAFIIESGNHNKSITFENALCGLLHKKLGQTILKVKGVSPNNTIQNTRQNQIEDVVDYIKNFEFTVNGTKGFKNAQITVGGASLNEFDDCTLESRLVKNLYCAGELLDVDSICGGFNLQWAWSSGITAGEQAAKNL